MLRFLVGIGAIGLLGLPFASGSDEVSSPAPQDQAVHFVTVRGMRVFPVRVEPLHIQFGHVENTDPTLDTEQ